MKASYIILFVMNGATKQIEYPKAEKEEAVAAYKNIRMRAERAKLFFYDPDFDEEYWHDISNKF